MRRVLLVLSVAALIAAMMMVMALPAFADRDARPGFADTQSGTAQSCGKCHGQGTQTNEKEAKVSGSNLGESVSPQVSHRP